MCWSEPVSWITFAVGTIFNFGAYAYFRAARSGVENMIIYWQYALLMQVAEGSAWRVLAGNKDADVAGPSRAAMILNVTQPFVIIIVVVCTMPSTRKLMAISAGVLYLGMLIAEASALWDESLSIRPQEGCSQLDLRWWDGTRTTLYILTSLFGFAAIPSYFWAIVNALIFLVTLFVALLTYPCGGGSLWCWIIFNAGLVLAACDVGWRLLRGDARMLRLSA